jgi:hypothetical protein
LIVDASGVSIFEYTAHESLRVLVEQLEADGVVVWEVMPQTEVAEAAARYRRAFGGVGVRRFPTIEAAVAAYLDRPATDGP